MRPYSAKYHHHPISCCHLYVQDEHKSSHVRTMQMAFNTWQLQRLMRIIKPRQRPLRIADTFIRNISNIYINLSRFYCPRFLSATSQECVLKVCLWRVCEIPFIACQWVKCIRLACGKRYDIQCTIYVNYAADSSSLRSSRVPTMICITQTLLPLIADRHLTIS